MDILGVARNAGIELIPVGQRWVGRCPFHREKTPSFSVDATLGRFHCFGCGVGGDTKKLSRMLREVKSRHDGGPE
jgi:DNA primase